MAEVLTLTTPIVPPSITTYRVRNFSSDTDTPYIKYEVVANTGAVIHVRFVPTDDPQSVIDIRNGLTFINQGKFAVNLGESLQKWLIKRAILAGQIPAGVVSGTPE